VRRSVDSNYVVKWQLPTAHVRLCLSLALCNCKLFDGLDVFHQMHYSAADLRIALYHVFRSILNFVIAFHSLTL